MFCRSEATAECRECRSGWFERFEGFVYMCPAVIASDQMIHAAYVLPIIWRACHPKHVAWVVCLDTHHLYTAQGESQTCKVGMYSVSFMPLRGQIWVVQNMYLEWLSIKLIVSRVQIDPNKYCSMYQMFWISRTYIVPYLFSTTNIWIIIRYIMQLLNSECFPDMIGKCRGTW